MKKIIKTFAIAIMAATTISCGANEKSITKITNGDKNKMDSLSYAYGIIIGEQYGPESSIVKDLNIDLSVFWKALKTTATGSEMIVGKDTLVEKNMQKIYGKAFTRDLQSKVIAAKKDSTGNTKVYNSEKERELVSAFIGTDIALSMIRMDIPMQLYWVENAYNEKQDGKATMSAREATSYINNYMMTVIPAENDKASKAWLAEVEKEKGVKKTSTGLLYKIENEGDMSAKPTSLNDYVTVHYKGTTRNGNVFDSSYDRGQTIEFPLNGVIKGWGEGLQLIGKGGKITLWIPAELAYGSRGAGNSIGPNEALRFDVELFEVRHAE